MLTALMALLLPTSAGATAPGGHRTAALRPQPFGLSVNLDRRETPQLLNVGTAADPEGARLAGPAARVLRLTMCRRAGAPACVEGTGKPARSAGGQ